MEEINNKNHTILEQLETAVKLKKWSALHMVELDALIVICEYEGDKGLIYSELFKGASHASTYGQQVWERINRIEALKLIWIQRDPNNKIESFLFHEDLKTILKEQYPNKFNQPKQDNQLDTFQFSLRREFRKSIGSNADYDGFFRLTKDVMLKEGHEYRFRGWTNDDESIFIKIFPGDQNIKLENEKQDHDMNLNSYKDPDENEAEKTVSQSDD